MIKRLLAGLAAALFAAAAAAQDYPTHTISIVVPFAAGGPTDTVTRLVAQSMTKTLGQTVIVENVAGAGGTIGVEKVAKAKPDGYTLLLMHIGISTSPSLYRNLRYDPVKDLDPIGLVTDVPMTLIGKKDFPPKDMKELITYVKANKDKVTYANAGVGAASHLCGMLLLTAIGTDVTTVPYKGTGPAMTDLIGGQVALSFDTNVAALPMLRAGHVKALAVTSARRSPSLPQVPTVAEAGYPGFEMLPWITIVAPRGLPPAVQKALGKALADTLADAAIRADLEKAGVDVSYEPGSFYDARVAKELPLLRAYVHKANIPLE